MALRLHCRHAVKHTFARWKVYTIRQKSKKKIELGKLQQAMLFEEFTLKNNAMQKWQSFVRLCKNQRSDHCIAQKHYNKKVSTRGRECSYLCSNTAHQTIDRIMEAPI